jgi:NAD(P)-dependent dehydrogenase (short-subunit alcohol dehydrogenase family)
MKVIIITGGSDGIGAEIARQLARRHGRGVVAGGAGRRAGAHRLQRHQVRHGRLLRGAAGGTQIGGRKREVVMSAKGKLGRWMKLIAPGLVEKMALAALKDDVKPH